MTWAAPTPATRSRRSDWDPGRRVDIERLARQRVHAGVRLACHQRHTNSGGTELSLDTDRLVGAVRRAEPRISPSVFASLRPVTAPLGVQRHIVHNTFCVPCRRKLHVSRRGNGSADRAAAIAQPGPPPHIATKGNDRPRRGLAPFSTTPEPLLLRLRPGSVQVSGSVRSGCRRSFSISCIAH